MPGSEPEILALRVPGACSTLRQSNVITEEGPIVGSVNCYNHVEAAIVSE